ncbi:unnamed protein product [Mycena citricolor]|uniref:Uncharacterized protein n=1 Tax=Mycena citricolor TaxID=2018698 RepID=A0AAD2HWK9_9AGAR|nr:unnamed protein product [Mycena citricolor]
MPALIRTSMEQLVTCLPIFHWLIPVVGWSSLTYKLYCSPPDSPLFYLIVYYRHQRACPCQWSLRP